MKNPKTIKQIICKHVVKELTKIGCGCNTKYGFSKIIIRDLPTSCDITFEDDGQIAVILNKGPGLHNHHFIMISDVNFKDPNCDIEKIVDTKIIPLISKIRDLDPTAKREYPTLQYSVIYRALLKLYPILSMPYYWRFGRYSQNPDIVHLYDYELYVGGIIRNGKPELKYIKTTEKCTVNFNMLTETLNEESAKRLFVKE